MATQRYDLEVTEKRSGSKVLLAFSFRKFVAQGVTIATINALTSTQKNVVPSTNLVISGQTVVGNKVLAFFDAGTSGESYIAMCDATLNDGQRIQLAGIINVLDRVV